MYETVKVELRTWREARGIGWSETLYSGLYLVIKDQAVLVAKLSHGLRAMLVKDLTQYQFEKVPGQLVEVPETFVQGVEAALNADLEFQKLVGVFNRAMSPAHQIANIAMARCEWPTSVLKTFVRDLLAARDEINVILANVPEEDRDEVMKQATHIYSQWDAPPDGGH